MEVNHVTSFENGTLNSLSVRKVGLYRITLGLSAKCRQCNFQNLFQRETSTSPKQVFHVREHQRTRDKLCLRPDAAHAQHRKKLLRGWRNKRFGWAFYHARMPQQQLSVSVQVNVRAKIFRLDCCSWAWATTFGSRQKIATSEVLTRNLSSVI